MIISHRKTTQAHEIRNNARAHNIRQTTWVHYIRRWCWANEIKSRHRFGGALDVRGNVAKINIAQSNDDKDKASERRSLLQQTVERRRGKPSLSPPDCQLWQYFICFVSDKFSLSKIILFSIPHRFASSSPSRDSKASTSFLLLFFVACLTAHCERFALLLTHFLLIFLCFSNSSPSFVSRLISIAASPVTVHSLSFPRTFHFYQTRASVRRYFRNK